MDPATFTTCRTIDEIISKHDAGLELTVWERCTYRLNVRPNGDRYSEDKKTRERQMDEDIAAEQARRRARRLQKVTL
jgi:hypothetical protein